VVFNFFATEKVSRSVQYIEQFPRKLRGLLGPIFSIIFH
jgi:hypothetical protein